jgi:hypothetical protein
MQFHLAHMLPPNVHAFRGFQEVIETLQWGLAELGHEVSVQTNAVIKGGINIVFGAQALNPSTIDALPADTVIYNLEQLPGTTTEGLRPTIRTVAERFRIWEYSPRNVEAWRQLGAQQEPVLVPIGWAPLLARIAKRQEEDIEVLFYGVSSASRLQVVHQLCVAGMRCVFACGLYGPARDELIARSKIVLNINLYATSKIFEVVRVSYLLANAKAVVADSHGDSFVEPDLLPAVAFAPPEQICATCRHLLDNEPVRRELEQRGQAIIQNRDIRPILRQALAASGI